MSNAAKLKKKAAEFEAKKQLDKALVLYRQILDDADPSDPDVDVGLFNRVGDLLLREGKVADAVNYYEKAVDLYAEGGFFNNAIALCNKILRQSPGRSSIYYKLGKISAKKGFTTDAKQNFLEYADRMQKAGQIDEAFRALKEFADLCPDQDDIRLMLAEQLAKRERKGEAMEQLQTLYERLEQEGRDSEARATLDRMKAIDPEVQPKTSTEGKTTKKGSDLVFLDVDYDTGPPRRPAPRATVKLPEPAVDTAASSAIADLPMLDVGSSPSAAGGAVDDPLEPVEFAAMRMGTPMDAPTVQRKSEHDLALPGDLPDLDTVGATDGLDLVMPDEAMEDDGLTLDGLVPPIGRSTREQPTLGTMGLDIQRGTSQGGADDLLIESTALGDGSGSRDVAPLAGFEQTTFDDMPMLDLAGDEQMLDLPDDVGGDDMLVIDEPPLARDDRATRKLTPAEIARVDAAARGGALLDDDALQLTDDADSGFNFLELPDEPARAGGDLPMLDTSAPAVGGGRGASAATVLGARVAAEPDNWELRRSWAEALLEEGDREAGIEQLDATMVGAERAGDLDLARSVADEVIRVDRDSLKHHQKRVEYAFRTSDRGRLIDAYLELADSLFRLGQPDKAKVVYQRVLELAPDDLRASAAISSISGVVAGVPARPAAAPPARATTGVGRRYTGDAGRTATPPESVVPVAPAAPARPKPRPAAPAAPVTPRPAQPAAASLGGDDASFVNLGDMLRADDMPKNTRMIVAEEEPSGDEQADFADMLRKFKQGVSENVDEEDYESHYDLGVAYKEMGLLDEAISEFQKALRGPSRRVRTYEALGQCFLEKKQWQVAATILQRADAEPDQGDEQLVGVLYLLGYAMEALQKPQEALMYYQRVFAVDIQFRDVAERLNAVEKVAR
jgi:tetratricopeptide (TPR) repeat protein